MRFAKNTLIGTVSAFLFAASMGLIQGSANAQLPKPKTTTPAPQRPAVVQPKQTPCPPLGPARPGCPAAQRNIPQPGRPTPANPPAPVRPGPVQPRPEPSPVKPPAPGPGPVKPSVVTPPVAPAPSPKPPAKVPGVASDGTFHEPKGSVTKPTGKGGSETTLPGNTKVQTNSKHQVTGITTPSGVQAKVNPKTGKPTVVSKVAPDGTGVKVLHSPTGAHHVEYVKKDSTGHNVRIVSRGSVVYREREFKRNGETYHARTTFDRNHQTVARVYRDHLYPRYGSYPVYVPDHYYQPAFYAYFGNPWATTVTFGWSSSPGYSYYGMYFAPAVQYNSPTVWMTDYVISANLQTSYAEQQPQPGDQSAVQPDQPEPQSAPTTPIPPTVRAEYVREVQTEVQDQQAAASGQAIPETVPGALNPKFPVLQSYSDVQVESSAGQCTITGGDFVRRDENTPAADKTVAVTVVSVIKASESHCPVDTHVRISVETLQDWYNGFIESTQQGFQAVVAQQGKNGFPPPPTTASVSNPEGVATPDTPDVVESSVREANTNASSAVAEVQTSGGQ